MKKIAKIGAIRKVSRSTFGRLAGDNSEA